MAFAAQLSALTDELVQAVASSTSAEDPRRRDTRRESSLRQLRHHSFLRTNQFEVYKQLDGLEERFRVLNRDGLADALRDRLTSLSRLSLKWAPETLHLLLELSDQPTQKSKLSDLDLLAVEPSPEDPSLTWDEIAREDGWSDDRHLWENINFADDSTDPEDDDFDLQSEVPDESEETTISSIEARFRSHPNDLVIETQDTPGLGSVQESQAWRSNLPSAIPVGKHQRVQISEAQAVRESLFMLKGLPTTLFDKDLTSSPIYQLSHSSDRALQDLLGLLSRAGRCLSLLREFTTQKQRIPLIQIFQNSIQSRLQAFDMAACDIESRIVDVQDDTVISILKLFQELKPRLMLLSDLSEIVRHFLQAKYPHPFRYLELLFDATTAAQLEGDDAKYEFLGTIFFECFAVYLRPIRIWVEDGELIDGDKIFFISATPTQVALHQIWKDQFKLRRTSDGTLLVPKFLQPATASIFTAGKSIVMLKLLGKHYSFDHSSEPPLDFSAVTASNLGNIAPFPEVFNAAVEDWMQTKHHAAYANLQGVLLKDCNLCSEIEALHSLYLMSDGSRSNALSTSIFNNLDLLNPNWHDRLNLTEVAHEAFTSVIDSRRIVMNVPGHEQCEEVGLLRRSVRLGLPLVRITYRLDWPIRIVISDDSISDYQAVFTFLIQLRRSKYVLQRHHLLSDGVADMSKDQAAFHRIRAKLLWFCNVLDSYLTMLVIGPLTVKLHKDLGEAQDVDAMIMMHSAFAKRMLDEACLGSKLDPIQQCILDVFDLSIKLEDARQAEAEREADETQELSRLSFRPSPTKKRYMKPSEEEDETFLSEQDKSVLPDDTTKDYADILRDVAADLDRHLKFLCGGLRGVARASSNPAASKWDSLAELLEFGIREQKSYVA